MIQIQIFKANGKDNQGVTVSVDNNATIGDVKKAYSKSSNTQLERIALRPELKGKNLKDDVKVSTFANRQFYFRDLGPQIPWKTVFLLEYAGPFFIYPIFFLRPSIIYGSGANEAAVACSVKLALICSTIHYGKRLFETQFIHRFSNGTMPQFNLFKNCSYYWGFCAFMAYFINHPSYTTPYFGNAQVYFGLGVFILSELGNLSIHILLRNLRPEGSKVRKIPRPDGNPLTLLFNYVSCPNYSYEFYSWIGFTIMTQSLPSALFTIAGFVQMSIWALQKHRNYKKEFPDYPKNRKAIIPYLL
ncbi:Sc2 [Strongyloides ratti]|uniref:very-long-chain enoyl-CoA reductase n=1 Tax=Strongyloides ratti TaxID=34506 RepID=A0A090LRD9_STRRB|nr:Sc2 [Strongyloides ratti]CEF70702.1 Sc2 [Strongyloides ratti]